jgi:hypothetical protein
MLNHNESTHKRGRDETFADEKAYTGVLAALGVMAAVGSATPRFRARTA